MPPIVLHMSIALEAAAHLGRSLEPDVLGNYLLGSTLPDVHIITGGMRLDTHFAELDRPDVDIRELFLQAHPELSPEARLDRYLASLVAGYLSHLTTDNLWIRHIFLPFFSTSSPLGKDSLAQIKDRALQYELDRRLRQDKPIIARMRHLLDQAPEGKTLGFIDQESLQRWHSLVLTTLSREPSWDYFPAYAQRILVPQGKVSEPEVRQFLAHRDENLEHTLGYISEARLSAFREKAIEESVRAAQGYLP